MARAGLSMKQHGMWSWSCSSGTSSLVLYNYIKSANLRFLSKIFVVSTVPERAFPSFQFRSGAGQSKFAADFSVNLLNLVNFTLKHHTCDLFFVKLRLEALNVGLLGEGRFGYGRSPIEFRRDLVSHFFSFSFHVSKLLLLLLKCFVLVSSDGALDVIEALQFVSRDDGLLLFIQSQGGRIVSFSLSTSSSAQDGGLDSGSTWLSAENCLALSIPIG